MACENCSSNDRFAIEAALAMAERTIRRLWIVIIILVIISAGREIAWTVYENQFADVQIDSEADTTGGDIFAINANGEVMYYGPYQADDQNSGEEK